jgi:hypothetical protein
MRPQERGTKSLPEGQAPRDARKRGTNSSSLQDLGYRGLNQREALEGIERTRSVERAPSCSG